MQVLKKLKSVLIEIDRIISITLTLVKEFHDSKVTCRITHKIHVYYVVA